MLQSSNQYLRPDYLAAPTALDTKSSPLALLAQTCSAIGADTTNPKLLAANIEKSTKSLKSSADGRDKGSPVGSQSSSVSTGSLDPPQPPLTATLTQQQQQQQQQIQQQQQVKSSFKPYESNNNHVRDRLEAEAERAAASGHRVRTPKSHSNGSASHQHNGQHQHHMQQQQQQQQRCDSNQSATSQRDSPAAPNGLRRPPSSSGLLDLQRTASPQRVSSKESAANAGHATPTAQASPSSAAAAATNARLHAASDAAFAAAKEANYMKALHAAAAAAGMTTSSSSSASAASSAPYYSVAYPPPGSAAAAAAAAAAYAPAMDLMTASALMSSPHHPMFKAAALNPYLNYARLKGLDPATAAAMMASAAPPNVCRDPYCTGCPSSPHYLNKAAGQPCPAGCPQCEAAGGAKGSLGGGGGGGSSSHSSGNSSSHNGGVAAAAAAQAAQAASSYHAQLAALAAASQLPYVCSWIAGDAAYCGKRFGTSDELFQHLRTHTASMPDSVLSAAAAGGIPPNHPLFQRTYPTPPLSPLSAARYHPYGKPSMLPPSLGPPGSLAGLSMQPHPALAQYFSPYSLYGPRLGSSHP